MLILSILATKEQQSMLLIFFLSVLSIVGHFLNVINLI